MIIGLITLQITPAITLCSNWHDNISWWLEANRLPVKTLSVFFFGGGGGGEALSIYWYPVISKNSRANHRNDNPDMLWLRLCSQSCHSNLSSLIIIAPILQVLVSERGPWRRGWFGLDTSIMPRSTNQTVDQTPATIVVWVHRNFGLLISLPIGFCRHTLTLEIMHFSDTHC